MVYCCCAPVCRGGLAALVCSELGQHVAKGRSYRLIARRWRLQKEVSAVLVVWTPIEGNAVPLRSQADALLHAVRWSQRGHCESKKEKLVGLILLSRWKKTIWIGADDGQGNFEDDLTKAADVC